MKRGVLNINDCKLGTKQVTKVMRGTLLIWPDIVASLTVSPTFKQANPAGETFSIQVVSNIAWTAVPENTWLTIISGGSGNGNGTIQVQAVANSTEITKVGNIKVTGGGITKYTGVNQLPMEVEPPADLFPRDGILYRFNFSQTGSNLTDLEGNYPAALNPGGNKTTVSSHVGQGWQLSGASTYISTLGRPYINRNLPVSAVFLVRKTEAGAMVVAQTQNTSFNYVGFSLALGINGVSVMTGNGAGIDSGHRRTYETLPYYSGYTDIGYHLVAININSSMQVAVSLDGQPFQNLTFLNGGATSISFAAELVMGRYGWREVDGHFSTPGMWDEAAGYERALTNTEMAEIWTTLNI